MAIMTGREFMDRDRNNDDDQEKCPKCGAKIDHTNEMRRMGFVSKGRIRIIAIPAGELPIEVREKWIGVEMPTICFEGQTPDAQGVLSGQALAPRASYIVDQAVALNALRTKDAPTADLWKEKGFPKHEMTFSFGVDEVEEIEPVEPRFVTSMVS